MTRPLLARSRGNSAATWRAPPGGGRRVPLPLPLLPVPALAVVVAPEPLPPTWPWPARPGSLEAKASLVCHDIFQYVHAIVQLVRNLLLLATNFADFGSKVS